MNFTEWGWYMFMAANGGFYEVFLNEIKEATETFCGNNAG